MPILARSANRSCSGVWVTSLPNTKIRPESGLSRPSASFRMVLLPDPATPNSALVSPSGRRNETPRSTLLSSNASSTFSNSMASAADSRLAEAAESRGKVGADMRLLERQDVHQKLSDKQNRHDQPHEHVLKHQRLPGVAPVLACVKVQQNLGDEQSAGQAHEVGDHGQ